MTRKKSASQLAMRFLVCLALLAPCAGQAGADSISIYSWTGWRQSTQVNYDDAAPWGGVSSLPVPETFTLPTYAYTDSYVQSVGWGATTLRAGAGVTYFRALFDMPDFAVLAADVGVSVDNDVEIYINRHLLVREGSFAAENFSAPHLGVSQGYEQVVNGSFGTQMFDWAAPTFPRTNWIRGGVNEVILVVRNLSYETSDWNYETGAYSYPGGFSFAMNISTTPNNPPVANSDVATAKTNSAATLAVLANDTDPDGQDLAVTAATQAAHGTVVLNPDGTISYTPTPNFNGQDSFTYTLSDGIKTATGTVTVTVAENLVSTTVARRPALSVPGPLTVKTGLPLRFTIKAADPNYSPPATLSTQVVARTLPAGASFRNDTLSWTPQSDQVGTYKVVFGAGTNTSPSLLSTKAVAITVLPNTYPDLLLGGDPGVVVIPGYWGLDYLWTYFYNEDWDAWHWRGESVDIWYPPWRSLQYLPGFELYKKTVTPTDPYFSTEYNQFTNFSFRETGAYSNYLSGFSGLSRLAVGNIDGFGLAEVVMGAGPGSGGLLTVKTYTDVSWWTKIINAGWDAYNQANGETWPAVGNLSGTGCVLVGLGKGGLGYIQAFLWRSGEIVYGGELYLPDAHNYNATNGTTRPAIGDLTGDGNNEIVVGVDGYGDGIPTRVYIATLAAGEWRFTPLEIPALAGLEDARHNCETWPAIGDLDGDGKNELVINVTKTVNGTRQPVGFGMWTSTLADGRLTFKLQAFKKAATFGLPALGDVFTPDGKAEIVLGQGPGSFTLSVFGVEIANGEWTILPEGTKASRWHDPFPALGEVAP